jgi:hypothetical protein
VDEIKRIFLSVFPAAKRRLLPAFEDLDKLMASARLLGVSQPILVRPYMGKYSEVSPACDVLTGADLPQLFLGGVMFECVRRDDRHNKRDKPYEVLAYGGRWVRNVGAELLLMACRYDHLLRHFSTPTQRHARGEIHGVGLSLATE